MLNVITHLPSPHLRDCELTFLDFKQIDLAKAQKEHENYKKMLESCSANVITIDENIDFPDSVFIEDPILVFDEIAILTSMGVESRRLETKNLEKVFAKYREIKRIELPARIEGGDVLKIGKKIFVGKSARTNSDGIRALRAILTPYGYEVIGVKVSGCLHLKTGCTALDDKTILLNPQWLDTKPFEGFKQVIVPHEEPFGANILKINDTICMNEAFPRTIEMVKALGYTVKTTDITEFVKAEAGLTCMCVPFLNN